MNTRSLSRLRQFGLRTLLIMVAIAAVTLVVGMAVYKNIATRRVAVRAIHISIHAATPLADAVAAKEFVRGLNPRTLSERLLVDPSFLEIPAVRAEADPRRWLVEHLRVREIEREDIASGGIFVDVRFVGAQAIPEQDLMAIVRKFSEAIQANAEDSDLKAGIVDRQSFNFLE